MAMGGLLISQKGNGNGQQRPRPCGLVLLLAFGVAMLAIMALHKLRERRISNLLQENSHHLISLQLLLQKQTEYTKQLKGKAEETKAKMNSLRKQKMELDHRLLEMLSTIDSLKDEQKTMESELVDKQNQIKLLRHSGNQNPQLPALIATLKQKEDEIQDLKHRLNSSLTTHHPANPPINITIMEPKTALTRAREDGGGADNSETGLRKEMDLATANLLRRHNSEAMSTNQDNSEARKVSENTGVNGEASNNTNEVNQQNFEATNDNSRDVEEQEKEVAERDEMEDMEISDKQAATNGDLSGDFMSDSQDKQGYKEEMDES